MTKETDAPAHNRQYDDYESQLRLLQIEFVKLQRHFIKGGERILVLIEGRDGAGKDGTIKRIVERTCAHQTGRFMRETGQRRPAVAKQTDTA